MKETYTNLCARDCTSSKSRIAHKMLSIDQKLEVLDLLFRKLYSMLCREHGIKRSAITDIKECEPEIQMCKSKVIAIRMGQSVKMNKLKNNEESEAAIFLWLKQKQEKGVSITGLVLPVKACEMHQQ